MTEAEKQDLASRIEDWLTLSAKVLLPRADEPSARIMNVNQLCAGWTTEAQDAFIEGVHLMTPFAGMSETWLPTMIYTKAAKRSIHRIVDILAQHLPQLRPTSRPTSAVVLTPKSQNRKNAKPHNRTTKQLQTIVSEMPTVVPRPKHINQYIHLLPDETKKRAGNYGQLIKDLGTARGNMRLLLDDPQATAEARERWAKTAVALDQEIGDLRKELDAEWNKLAATGRVTVDCFGMAHIVDKNGNVAGPKPTGNVKANCASTKSSNKADGSHAAIKQYAEEDKIARVKYLQKWLRDSRPNATNEHKKRWQENAKELIALGGELTESIKRAGAHYNATVPT